MNLLHLRVTLYPEVVCPRTPTAHLGCRHRVFYAWNNKLCCATQFNSSTQKRAAPQQTKIINGILYLWPHVVPHESASTATTTTSATRATSEEETGERRKEKKSFLTAPAYDTFIIHAANEPMRRFKNDSCVHFVCAPLRYMK